MERLDSIEALQQLRDRLKKEEEADKRPTVVVCGGTGCETFGGHAIFGAFEDLVEKRQLHDKVRVKKTGGQGLCEKGPLVNVWPNNIFYQKVKEQDTTRILEETALDGGIIQKLLYTDPNTNQKVVYQQDIPFYKKQLRIVLKLNGIVDPASIEDYIIFGGYASLAKALTKCSPDDVIKEITDSGLKGRGGAGFSTGTKWGFVRNAPGDKKYV
ncbi:MAG: NADH-quinone oxidoreductase subunit F, partial [Candidatus Brocadiales bacterium]